MAFILNQYNVTLDLTDRENQKLFNLGCKGLDEKDAFVGKKQKYIELVKLIEREYKDISVICAVRIATLASSWKKVGAR